MSKCFSNDVPAILIDQQGSEPQGYPNPAVILARVKRPPK
jgi:hypothetical protein